MTFFRLHPSPLVHLRPDRELITRSGCLGMTWACWQDVFRTHRSSEGKSCRRKAQWSRWPLKWYLPGISCCGCMRHIIWVFIRTVRAVAASYWNRAECPRWCSLL